MGNLLSVPPSNETAPPKWLEKAKGDMKDRLRNMMTASSLLSGFTISGVVKLQDKKFLAVVGMVILFVCWLLSHKIVNSYDRAKKHPMRSKVNRAMYGFVNVLLVGLPLIGLLAWYIAVKRWLVVVVVVVVILAVCNSIWCWMAEPEVEVENENGNGNLVGIRTDRNGDGRNDGPEIVNGPEQMEGNGTDPRDDNDNGPRASGSGVFTVLKRRFWIENGTGVRNGNGNRVGLRNDRNGKDDGPENVNGPKDDNDRASAFGVFTDLKRSFVNGLKGCVCRKGNDDDGKVKGEEEKGKKDDDVVIEMKLIKGADVEEPEGEGDLKGNGLKKMGSRKGNGDGGDEGKGTKDDHLVIDIKGADMEEPEEEEELETSLFRKPRKSIKTRSVAGSYCSSSKSSE